MDELEGILFCIDKGIKKEDLHLPLIISRVVSD